MLLLFISQVHNDINIHSILPNEHYFGRQCQVIHDDSHSQLIIVMELFSGGQMLHWNSNRIRYSIPTPDNPQFPTTLPDTIDPTISYAWYFCFKEEPLKHCIRSMLKALNCLHTLHVVHKDVKPDNVLISKKPSAELVEAFLLPDLPEVRKRQEKIAQERQERETARLELLRYCEEREKANFGIKISDDDDDDEATGLLDAALGMHEGQKKFKPLWEGSENSSSGPSFGGALIKKNHLLAENENFEMDKEFLLLDVPDSEDEDVDKCMHEERTSDTLIHPVEDDDGGKDLNSKPASYLGFPIAAEEEENLAYSLPSEEMGDWVWGDSVVVDTEDDLKLHLCKFAAPVAAELKGKIVNWCRCALADFNTATWNVERKNTDIFDAEGTQMFTPPECFQPRSEEEFASGIRNPLDGSKRDVWSVGVTMFVALFGEPPFRGDSALELQLNILHEELVIPSFRKLSDDCFNFLMKLMERDPKKRLSCREALEHPWLKVEEVCDV